MSNNLTTNIEFPFSPGIDHYPTYPIKIPFGDGSIFQQICEKKELDNGITEITRYIRFFYRNPVENTYQTYQWKIVIKRIYEFFNDHVFTRIPETNVIENPLPEIGGRVFEPTKYDNDLRHELMRWEAINQGQLPPDQIDFPGFPADWVPMGFKK